MAAPRPTQDGRKAAEAAAAAALPPLPPPPPPPPQASSVSSCARDITIFTAQGLRLGRGRGRHRPAAATKLSQQIAVRSSWHPSPRSH
eukprot:359602-Chlamydomonas_euryale.AAC.14